MLESPLPQWIRDQLTEMIDAHLMLLPLLEERCMEVAEAGRRNPDGDLCDQAGTLDGYRLDGKYIAGQVVRLLHLLRERMSESEWERSPYCDVPVDPETLADWAWKNPWKHLKVRLEIAAMDEAPLKWRDFYLLYPEKERKALVYTMGCGMSLQETADKMSTSKSTVQTLLQRARARGKNARDERAGIHIE